MPACGSSLSAVKTVSFTRMIDGTREEYAFLAEQEHVLYESVAGNVLVLLEALKGPKLGYPVDRYEHSLQTASRALRDGADEETVVCALLHDVGDTHAPHNHGGFVADILKPYVSEENRVTRTGLGSYADQASWLCIQGSRANTRRTMGSKVSMGSVS